jgi:septum formation protein
MTAELILASGSPRRAKLLAEQGIRFEIHAPDIDETPAEGEAARDYVLRMAREKALTVLGWATARQDVRPVLGADTCVAVEGEILGKPRSEQEFMRMMALLSDRTHQVYSAVCVCQGEQIMDRLVETRVTFRDTTPGERQRYWETGEPLDKAGGYAIQGRAGAFIPQIEGSYTAVVGLPVCETLALLECFNAGRRGE